MFSSPMKLFVCKRLKVHDLAHTVNYCVSLIFAFFSDAKLKFVIISAATLSV